MRIRHTPRTCIVSSAGEIRTRRHWFLRPAAHPLAYRTKPATHTGFEPVISTVTGWRPLQTGLMGRFLSLAVAPDQRYASVSGFELAQDVLQTSSAPHGLVPII